MMFNYNNTTYKEKVLFSLACLLLFFNPISLGLLFSPDKWLDPLLFGKVLYFDILIILIAALFLSHSKKIKLLTGSILFCFIVIEALIAFNPIMFGQNTANAVLSKYKYGIGGMKYFDKRLGMDFLKPDFNTENYWNGYSWNHTTDKNGLRNNTDPEQADIILIGDSFIYGHGVEQNQTVAHFLSELTEQSVYNLARPGDSTFQQLYLLYTYGLKKKPSIVLYFFFENDVYDLQKYLSKEEVKSFLKKATPPMISTKPKQSSAIVMNLTRGLLDSSFHLPTVILSGIKKFTENDEQNKGRIHPTDKYSAEWNYTRKSIRHMSALTYQAGSEFYVINIPVTIHTNVFYKNLKTLAEEMRVKYIDSSFIRLNPEHFLPNDGHFSEQGAKAMAELIAKQLNSL